VTAFLHARLKPKFAWLFVLVSANRFHIRRVHRLRHPFRRHPYSTTVLPAVI
jgi:hypothetical protein